MKPFTVTRLSYFVNFTRNYFQNGKRPRFKVLKLAEINLMRITNNEHEKLRKDDAKSTNSIPILLLVRMFFKSAIDLSQFKSSQQRI